MIEINLDKTGGREFLHATPAGLRDTPLPTLFFYHGFLSSKLVYSYFAVALAQVGFRVIMPDADEHGARFTGMKIGVWGNSGRFCKKTLMNFQSFIS